MSEEIKKDYDLVYEGITYKFRQAKPNGKELRIATTNMVNKDQLLIYYKLIGMSITTPVTTSDDLDHWEMEKIAVFLKKFNELYGAMNFL